MEPHFQSCNSTKALPWANSPSLQERYWGGHCRCSKRDRISLRGVMRYYVTRASKEATTQERVGSWDCAGVRVYTTSCGTLPHVSTRIAGVKETTQGVVGCGWHLTIKGTLCSTGLVLGKAWWITLIVYRLSAVEEDHGKEKVPHLAHSRLVRSTWWFKHSDHQVALALKVLLGPDSGGRHAQNRMCDKVRLIWVFSHALRTNKCSRHCLHTHEQGTPALLV